MGHIYVQNHVMMTTTFRFTNHEQLKEPSVSSAEPTHDSLYIAGEQLQGMRKYSISLADNDNDYLVIQWSLAERMRSVSTTSLTDSDLLPATMTVASSSGWHAQALQ